MTIRDFNKLANDQKEQAILEKSQFVHSYIKYEFICDLFKINNFYVRICFQLHSEANSDMIALEEEAAVEILERSLFETRLN